MKSGAISIGEYQKKTTGTAVDGTEDTYMIPQGFVVVKSNALATPELLPQSADNTGPETSSLNQSDRVTQSETEDQESTEFFGSKEFVTTKIQDEKNNKAKKTISIADIEKIAQKHNISLEDAFKKLEDFDDDY